MLPVEQTEYRPNYSKTLVIYNTIMKHYCNFYFLKLHNFLLLKLQKKCYRRTLLFSTSSNNNTVAVDRVARLYLSWVSTVVIVCTFVSEYKHLKKYVELWCIFKPELIMKYSPSNERKKL